MGWALRNTEVGTSSPPPPLPSGSVFLSSIAWDKYYLSLSILVLIDSLISMHPR
jgi:hypothetical protein